MEVASLSALRTSHEIRLVLIFVRDLVDPIRNRTRDLPACVEVPQLTAPPRAPILLLLLLENALLLILFFLFSRNK
jgi:hypothetical protein